MAVLAAIFLFAFVIIVSTGAFSGVSADRYAHITVSGDATALLALAPFPGPNGKYVHYDDDGSLYIEIAGPDSAGININSQCVCPNLFTITNNGTQDVTLTLSKRGLHPTAIDFGDIEDSVSLGKGETYVVSFDIDTTQLAEGDSVIDAILLKAVTG